ncbi:MAG: lipase/acylhydrolase, GDSL-like [Pedosphaera sp.]|nr:lipase/acylhydrolase, GDSL-like [Pedosphaera sp.]
MLNAIDLSGGKVSVSCMIDPSRAAGSATAEVAMPIAPPADISVKTKSAVSFAQSAPDRSLDQWRGLALVLVLISHAYHVTGRVPGIGRAGVNLFFFISGILVFRTLSRGPQGKLAGAKYFWVRRTKRLVPAKYFYLFGMALLVLIAVPRLISPAAREAFFSALPSSLLYYRNYFGSEDNLTSHLWSVACEMQFYLLAPLIFFAGGKSIARRLGVYGVVLGLLLVGGLSVVGKTNYSQYTFGVAAWPMMAGFFVEFLRTTFPKQVGAWGRLLTWCGAVSLVVLALAMLTVQKQVVILAGTLLVAGCLGCYLEGIAPRGWLGNVFHYLGNRTYSIYLWQQPLTLGGFVPPAFHPLGSLLAIPVGALSFHFLELPYMSKYNRQAPPTAPRRSLLARTFILVLIASLGLNIGLCYLARQFYARELLVRLQPEGPSVVSHSGKTDGLRVLFLGDSRAAQWPALPTNRFCTINAGVPGATTAQVRLRAEQVLLIEKPDVVVLQVGINDLKTIGVVPQVAGAIQEQCTANISEIIHLCRQHNAGVVLTLIIPSGKVSFPRRLVWSDKIETAVDDVNGKLARQFEQVAGVAVFEPGKFITPADYRDTLHVYPSAYQKCEAGLLPLVERLGVSPSAANVPPR